MLKELHDLLLAMKPEDAAHDEAACSWCTSAETASATTPVQGGSVTEEEVRSLQERNAALEAKVSELESAQQSTEIDAKVAAVKAEFEVKLDELQKQLDAAVLEATNVKAERDAVLAWLAAEAEAAQKAEEIARLKGERSARVLEVANFPAEYVESQSERWAALSEEAFVALLEDYKALSAESAGAEIPAETAMTPSRETASASASNPILDVAELRFRGVDVRTVR